VHVFSLIFIFEPTVNFHRTNDARCTPAIKDRIAMAKAAFNEDKTLFTSKLNLNLRKKLVECYI
jgi:hypothetical protein